MLSINISNIAIISVKNVVYRCIIHNISKSEAITLLKILCLKIWSESNKNYYSGQFIFIFVLFFAIYKMVDSEYSMDVYKSVKNNHWNSNKKSRNAKVRS